MFKILIVDDSQIIASSLKKDFEKWGYEVVLVENFERVFDLFKEENPSLVVMDIGLPYFDGYHWTRKIRDISNVPIIFLSSKEDTMNKIMAMEMGADDFVTKPFEVELLTAKVKALLRRTYDYKQGSDKLEKGGLILDLKSMQASFEGKSIDLSKNEFKILETLMVNDGKVISRDKLMTALWSTDIFIDDNTLTVNISRLRKSLESLGVKDFIKTKVGKGYYV
ncbi:response regulator transcription factor [Anaerococcus sp. NML200537]|uniref:response regulator transcription factor n=1 Tax=Anaerococcus sp. NML200537 TaxID=2954485 RepID=UPI0022373C4F|nr:response regulator transcription factor [Anaerococcus sp. NML200537]MCW6700481.1 response regulator transcription factor [Anaerococcus sp. NML200537]